MAATCDVSFDEMAVALSYISLGGAAAAPASSARGLPSLAPVKKDKPAKKAAEDDDVSSKTRKTKNSIQGWCPRRWVVAFAARVVRRLAQTLGISAP